MIQSTALRHPHITQELHRRVRPGKMGPIVRVCIWTALLLCAVSGLLEYWQTDWALSFKPLGRWPLVLHGISGMGLAIGFGLLMQSHIRAAWRMKKHRVSGGVMVSLMTLLIVSGLLLYYGGETIHDANEQLHIVLGIGFAGMILWHGLYRYIAELRQPSTR
jgi:succinate dehydrogenase/fumarate reductase cytochrome b subunit